MVLRFEGPNSPGFYHFIIIFKLLHLRKIYYHLQGLQKLILENGKFLTAIAKEHPEFNLIK